MHDSVKKAADANDIKSLKYIFVDALDVDPTFEYYQEDYDYVKTKGLFEPHRELSGLNDNTSTWNMDYWKKIKLDLPKNFSEKRLMHMREVAKVVYAEKIRRFQSAVAEKSQPISAPPPMTTPMSAPSPASVQAANLSTIPSVSEIGEKQAAENRRFEERKRQFAEEENKRRAQRASARQAAPFPMGGNTPKKASGDVPTRWIVGAGVGIAVLITILLLRK